MKRIFPSRRRTARGVGLLCALLLAIVGCGASDSGSTPGGEQSEPGAGTVVSDAELPDLDPALRDSASWARAMTYRSRSGIDDDNTHVTGVVLAPKGEPPDGGFPVVALAPRVVGTASDCAASLSPDLLGSAGAAAALLNAGYVVFVPDYQGLGEPSDSEGIYHPYLDSTTAGYVVIDGVRAAKTLAPVKTSNSWAALGSLEGGQAAWAANELVENYGSGLDLVATASLAPLADFEGLADAAMVGTLTAEQKLVYVAYLAAVASEHEYDVDLDSYRRGAAQQNWDALLSCQQPDRLALAEQIPPQDLKPADEQALTTLRGYMQKTTLPQGPTAAPMYVIYGGADPMIPAAWTERAIGRACQMGDVIQVAEWPDKGHQDIDPLAGVGWLVDRLKSNPSANDCAPFLADHPVPPGEAPAPRRPAAADEPDTQTSAPTETGVALTSGWLPATIQLTTLALLAVATGLRSEDWRLRWIPAALMVGFATAAAARLFVKYQGWNQEAASMQAVSWTAASGFALGVAVFGWPRSPWWRRSASVASVLLCVLSAGMALNTATGYFPTVTALWRQATGATPDDWIDEATLAQMVRDKATPAEGVMVWVDIPNDASGFDHRPELVYLPPAWFRSDPPPKLPTFMMLGGEFSQPSDWPVAASAVTTLNRFAAAHGGNAPVVVFPDTTGSLSNDTECVNGPRGNAADHLMKDVVPFIISEFGVSADPANWGLVGWSSGGTCALMTTVMHPEVFSAFVALDGQLGPNTGTKRQTIARLFGGDAAAWAAFDPRTVIEKHGPYDDMAAWLGVSEDIPADYRSATITPPDPSGIAEWDPYSEEHEDNSRTLCLLLSGHNVECSVVGYGGSHDFLSAGEAFSAALPWLAGRLGTPDVPERPLPGRP
ncbi:alpha/beta hydrolase-fold protein [Mycobacterium sp. NPDC051804]|uniref:alpha/beta hydrolase-fold protein n=1 Tax=Mycobacterium sp. NPDC051804 TaxID=3364295 RepID=UPI0037B4362C